MKVSLGMKLQLGPWGGGNKFGQSLTDYLQRKGIEVFYDLTEPKLDLIVLTEPRSTLRSSAYSDKEVLQYLSSINPRAIVIHRFNECDERKGTTGINRIVMQANKCADHTVFISNWLRDLFLSQGLKISEYSVILNGADTAIFNPMCYESWDGRSKFRLVTHHWGGGYLKGFDIYERLDRMLEEAPWRERIDFTYIGNLPKGFRFTHTRYIAPLSGLELADTIRSHHVYLTASQNEPAGMHHIEGAMCGLPLLYRESGALPEYCNGFGISFKAENFEQKLQEMIDTYDYWVERMKDYPHTAERMCVQYYELFVSLLDRREEIMRKRRRCWWYRPLWLSRIMQLSRNHKCPKKAIWCGLALKLRAQWLVQV